MKVLHDTNYYTETEVRKLTNDFKTDFSKKIDHIRNIHKGFLFEELPLLKYCQQQGIFYKIHYTKSSRTNIKYIVLKLKKTNFNLFYEKKEVADILGISIRQFDHKQKNNDIKLIKYKLSNGRCFFLRFEVDAFVVNK